MIISPALPPTRRCSREELDVALFDRTVRVIDENRAVLRSQNGIIAGIIPNLAYVGERSVFIKVRMGIDLQTADASFYRRVPVACDKQERQKKQSQPQTSFSPTLVFKKALLNSKKKNDLKVNPVRSPW